MNTIEALPDEPEALALTRTAFYSPDGQTAIMRIVVAESDEWGELTLEHDCEEDEQGPPTWHVLFHELGHDPLGELIADGDVWEWCLHEGLAPGQRAWVRLRIGYTKGTYEYPDDIDRIVEAELVSIEPMEPADAAERWEAFLWRREHLGLEPTPEVRELVERARRDVATFASEVLGIELTEAQKAIIRGVKRHEPTGEDLLAAIRRAHATSPQGAEGHAGDLVERVNRQVAAEDHLRETLERVLNEEELERLYHVLRHMHTDPLERWNDDENEGTFG